MEFKESYKFMDYLLFIIITGLGIVANLGLIVFACPYGFKTGQTTISIILLVVFVLFIAILLWIIFLLSIWITIDKDKIQLKELTGVIVSYNISDIYKIEKVIGPKGVPAFMIYGSTPQDYSRKSFHTRDSIPLLVTNKSTEVLKHFVTNPEVWQIDIE